MLAGDPILEDCMWNSEPVVIYNFFFRVVFQVTFLSNLFASTAHKIRRIGINARLLFVVTCSIDSKPVQVLRQPRLIDRYDIPLANFPSLLE